MARLGAPQRIVTIVESESLINDGVALTVFGLAVEAMMHPFTFGHGVLRLAEAVIGGIGYGLIVAVAIGRIRRRARDPMIQLLITLITPFVAYIPAEQLDVSGVLATVVTGAYLGTRTEGLLQPASRVSGTLFWRTLVVRAQRDKLAELYRTGKISDEIRRSISRSLDLAEPRPFG